MPRKMGKVHERGKTSGLQGKGGSAAPSAPTVQADRLNRAPQSAALKVVFANALLDKEGLASGAVGSMRFGKTYWLQRVLAHGFDLGVWARGFVHDAKKIVPQYEGPVLASADEWLEQVEKYEGDRVLVFNGGAWDKHPTGQEVCEVARAVADEGEAVVVVADEIYKLTNGWSQWLPGRDNPETGKPDPALFPAFMREGVSQKISALWSTQIPQTLPTECKVLSGTVALFHLEGLAADAACEHFRLGKEAPALLRSLERGQFLLFSQGQDWDRTIYGPG